jgi:hypothetical protein
MLQLICHLVGDYILQTHWMAQNKTKRNFPAAAHAFCYTVPFLFLLPTASLVALWVICISHFVIDRWRLAVYVVYLKNWVTQPDLTWEEAAPNSGYPKTTPAWLAVWLTIIADNTIHLSINYAALRWL